MATGTFRATYIGDDPKYKNVQGEAHGATTLGLDDTRLRERGWTPEKWWEFRPANDLPPVWCDPKDLEVRGYIWDPE